MTQWPGGFTAHVANVRIKDDTPDFAVLAADRRVPAAGLFTRSRFAGPSVTLSRESVADGYLRAVVIISKNANVANGARGEEDARAVVDGVARALGCAPEDVAIASTGVIGRPYPMDRLRPFLDGLADRLAAEPSADVEQMATAIMTTDTHPKVAEARAGAARVVGIAKGVGMIEPDMATLITLLATDAEVDPAWLDGCFRRVIARTFNAVSIDGDTSTSDTALVLASGAAGAVDLERLEAALGEVALSLTKQVARDGEGATKLLEVTVEGARDEAQAKRVAKSIVNSPLVKTAVHGADPNWGRVAMAVGKCSDDTDIRQDCVVIRFGDQELYPRIVGEDELESLAEYLAGDHVRISVDLGLGDAAFTVWGCDLSDGYVRINADYTT